MDEEGETSNKSSRSSSRSSRRKKRTPHLSLHTLENLISDNLPLVTMMTAIDDETRTWYQLYEDIYDTENCLFEKKILADHRNQIKLQRADMMLADLKLPDVPNTEDILWMDRKIIEPLEEELQKPVSK